MVTPPCKRASYAAAFLSMNGYVSTRIWYNNLSFLQMKMTEIYDVTDADTDVMQSPSERSVNKELEFDNDWSTELLADNGE